MKKIFRAGFVLAILTALSLGAMMLTASDLSAEARCQVPFPSCKKCEKEFIECCIFCSQPGVACFVPCEIPYQICVDQTCPLPE